MTAICESCGGPKTKSAYRCKKCTPKGKGELHYLWKPDPDPAELRDCTRCHRSLPLAENYKRYLDKRTDRYRYEARCNRCRSELAREWNKRNPYRAKMADQRYKARHLRKRRLRLHGLSEIAMACLEASQQGLCLICWEYVGDALVIDHDHATGAVRGLLCGTCNLGLGAFKDSPERLLRAIHYLDFEERRKERERDEISA